MKAEDVKFTDLFHGPRQFIVPVFQRDYSWGRGHCQQLWEDVVRVGNNPNAKAHFVGSVVYIAAEDNAAKLPRWLLIDGQQRVTTVTLLIAALKARLLSLGASAPEGADDEFPTAAELDDYYLRNQHGKNEKRHKLHLRRSDHETLVALIDGTDLPANPSERVKDNYNYFCEQLEDADLVAVYNGVSKLVAVDVSLKRGEDDPQMIFESLNSTGKELSQADLIRNFVLMRQPEEEQTRLYQEYWLPLEKAFGHRYDTHFDRFMRDFLSLQMRLSKPINSGEVYDRFKEYFFAWEGGVEALLSEIRRFGRYYAAFNFDLEGDASLLQAFRNLRTVVDVASPVVLRLYDAFDRLKTLSISEFREAVVLLESYIFRRSVCEMQTRSLGNIFASLALRIEDAQPLRSLKVALHRSGESRKFPSDSEFYECLVSRDVYHMRNCRYMLDRLENDSREKTPITDEFSIEHVMPQNENLGSEWRAMLGENWKEIQQTWLHRLGNVTLTAYNSKYSDRPYSEKKTTENGFDDSSLRLNGDMQQSAVWTPEQMEPRGKKLAQHATQLWPALVVDPQWVREAELVERLAWAKANPVEKLEMEPHVRGLFDILRPQLLALGEDLHELGQSKSVVYRVFDFVLEVIPRKAHLALVLNLDFSDQDDWPVGAEDTTKYSWVANARERGGVYFPIWYEDRIPDAVKLARTAYEKVTQ